MRRTLSALAVLLPMFWVHVAPRAVEYCDNATIKFNVQENGEENIKSRNNAKKVLCDALRREELAKKKYKKG